MNKRLIVLMALMLCVPILLYSQASNYKEAVDWLQGGNILEDWFMKIFRDEYKTVLKKSYGTYTGIAQTLGGIFALIYFFTKGYEMMLGDGRFQIMPLLKPFGLLMIIIWWVPFCDAIAAPIEFISQHAARDYENSVQANNTLRYKRWEMQRNVVDGLFEVEADNTIALKSAEKSFWDDPVGKIGDGIRSAFDTVVKPVVKLNLMLKVSLQLFMTQLLETLALWILRICVYVIFVIQIIYSGILIILGPLSVAFSILPMFKDSFASWLARFISVQFYVVVAFIALKIGATIQYFALSAEIDRYSELVTATGTVADAGKLMFFASNGLLSFGMVIVSFIISAIAILTTPSVSTWIISTTGIGSAIHGMVRGGAMVAGGAGKAAALMS